MIDLDKVQFAKMLLATMQVYDKAPDQSVYDSWFRALRPFSLGQIQNALDQHVKHGRYAPRPGDITRRINGTDDRSGDAKETQPAKDRRCVYEQNGARCPAATSYFTFGSRGYCHEHERHQDDPAHMQRILDDYLLNGVPGPPPTPHRQRAEYLWAVGGAELVLAGKPCDDGTSWGPYDQRVVRWLQEQDWKGLIEPPFSHVPGSTIPGAARQIAVAEAVHTAAQLIDSQLEPELF